MPLPPRPAALVFIAVSLFRCARLDASEPDPLRITVDSGQTVLAAETAAWVRVSITNLSDDQVTVDLGPNANPIRTITMTSLDGSWSRTFECLPREGISPLRDRTLSQGLATEEWVLLNECGDLALDRPGVYALELTTEVRIKARSFLSERVTRPTFNLELRVIDDPEAGRRACREYANMVEQDADTSIRGARSLAVSPSEDCVEALLQALSFGRHVWTLSETLRRVNTPRAVTALETVLRTGKTEARQAARRGLERLVTESHGSILQTMARLALARNPDDTEE